MINGTKIEINTLNIKQMSKKLSTKMKNHLEHTAERSVIKRTRRKNKK